MPSHAIDSGPWPGDPQVAISMTLRVSGTSACGLRGVPAPAPRADPERYTRSATRAAEEVDVLDGRQAFAKPSTSRPPARRMRATLPSASPGDAAHLSG